MVQILFIKLHTGTKIKDSLLQVLVVSGDNAKSIFFRECKYIFDAYIISFSRMNGEYQNKDTKFSIVRLVLYDMKVAIG